MPIETDPAETPEDATTADPQAEEERAESAETETAEGSETGEDQGKAEAKPEEPEEFEIVIDGEPAAKAEDPPKDAAAWAAMRVRERELKAENAQLKREQLARTQPATAADPGEEPTLESSGWDETTLKAKHVAWLKAKETQDSEKAQASQKADAARRKWEDNKATIVKSRESLIQRMPSTPEKPGYLDAEANVDAAFSRDRLGKMAAIMHVCGEKTPMVVAALGQDPARLKDLADEEDMARFIAKVSKLEDKVQEKKKGTTPPPPESKIRGTGGSSGAVDAQEERLREQSMKGGAVDITALRAYKKSRAK